MGFVFLAPKQKQPNQTNNYNHNIHKPNQLVLHIISYKPESPVTRSMLFTSAQGMCHIFVKTCFACIYLLGRLRTGTSGSEKYI